jgi:hypothetical protein
MLHNVFTEQGVAMLSSVLNSERAIKITQPATGAATKDRLSKER